MKVLVTGGVRSGKSRHAEALVGEEPATYVAAGPSPDVEPDPDWAVRVAAHRERRPAAWSTRETSDLAAVLTAADQPVLVDCLGTWLAGVIDADSAWEASADVLDAMVTARLETVLSALRGCETDVVLVTNEVGLGVVPEHRSGRVFRDLLGTVNLRVAEACDEVHLVVAGRVLRI